MAAPTTEPTVFTVYEQLRREIQALLQENADLRRIVTQLREQRNQRHNVRGPPGALVPSSAPPILGSLPGPGAGHFPFPGSGSSQDSSLGLSQLFHSQPAGSAGAGSLSSLGLSQLFHNQPAGSPGAASLDSSLGLSRMYHSYPWESTRLNSPDSSLGLSRLFQSQPGDSTLSTGAQDSSLGLSRLFQSQPGDSTLSSGSLDSSLALSRLFQSQPGDSSLSSGGYSSSLSFPSLDSSSFSSSDNSNVLIESFAPNRNLPVPTQYYHVPQRWYMSSPGGIETGPSGPGPSGSAASGPGPSGPGPSGSAASGPGPSGPSPGGAGSSVPGPSVHGPSGPAPSSAGPSDPSPSGSSPSGSSPSGAGPGGAGPSDPSPSDPSPSGSSPSGSSPSGSSPSGAGPGGAGPSDPSPSDPSPSGPSPGSAGPSVPSPSGPSPGGAGAGASNDAMQQVVSLPAGQQSFAPYSNRTLAGLRPMPSSDNPLYCQLMGEIAYQLDRRILAHVFPNQRRFYGFTISNIPEKITVAIPNMQDSVTANMRYREVMTRLRRFGYNPQTHPLFCEALVNTYGVLSEVARPAVLDAISMDLLMRAIHGALPPRAGVDGIIILDCLLEMVRTGGGPLFMY